MGVRSRWQLRLALARHRWTWYAAVVSLLLGLLGLVSTPLGSVPALLAGLAGVLLMYATLLAPAARIAPTQYSQMLWAIGFGYWLFGDHLDWPMLAGIALILGAGLFTLVREEKVTPWWRRAKMV